MDCIQKKCLCWTGLILSVVLVLWAVVFLAVLEDGVWANYEGSVGICESVCENSHDCPADMSDRPIIQQPINAWTNVSFLVLGSLVISRRQDIGSAVFFLTNLYIFIASFMFHASLTEVWAALDFGAVFTAMLAIFCQALHATFEFPWAKMAVAVLLGGLFYSLVLVYSSKISPWVVLFVDVSAILLNFVAAWVLAIVLVTVRIRKIHNHNSNHDASQQIPLKRRKRDVHLAIMWLVGPMILFLVAFTCFTLDTLTGIWCNPEDAVQGHSLWHILAAVAYYLAWEGLSRYHRRDEPYKFPEEPKEDLAPEVRKEGEKEAPPEIEKEMEVILKETSVVGDDETLRS